MLFLVILSCARIFFIRNVRSDPISVVPLIAFLCSILNFFAFGLTVSGILVFVLAFFVFIWNIRALLRLNAQLVIDHYGALFILISLLNLVLAFAVLAFVIYFRPVPSDLKKFGVEKSTMAYFGNFEGGFLSEDFPLHPKTAYVSVYKKNGSATVSQSPESPESTKENAAESTNVSSDGRRIIVFVPGECATVETYEPTFVKLAHDGYTVYAADFYTGDSALFGTFLDSRITRRFASCLLRLSDENEYQYLVEGKIQRLQKQYRAVLDFTDLQENDFVFLVGDTLIKDSMLDIQIGFPGNVVGSFDISSLKNYPTPAWGPVEQTSPFLATLLGRKRDSSRYLASRLAAAIENAAEENLMLYKTVQSAEKAGD